MKKRILLLLLSLIFSALLYGCSSNIPGDEPLASPSPSIEEAGEKSAKEPAIVAESPIVESKAPEWVRDITLYEVNIRQYTPEGTFTAFQEHLPRLKEMGVEALWFMPIHPISEVERKGTLGSYYAIQDYTGVNPEFGTEEEFKQLVDTCHEMGFKVVLDWVANHTGWDNPWITQHSDWYVQNDKGDIVIPPGTDWTDVAQLNFDNPFMREAMSDAMAYWVNEFDVDGFRCDYAIGVPRDFWEDARLKLEKTKPIYMLAEDNTSKAFLAKAFDSNYGWKLFGAMNDVAKGGKPAAIKSIINSYRTYPNDSFPLNFTDNHDENSWNGTVDERLGEASHVMSVITFTVPGMPLIYSGQEAGLDRRLEFFEKDEIDWTDLKNEQFFQQLIQLKKQNPALYSGANYGGDIKFYDTTEANVLVYERFKDDNRVIVILNLSGNPVTTDIAFDLEDTTMTEYFSGATTSITTLGKDLTLNPWGYAVYTK